jgi:myo-inositol-1(or 4)-monophosphatase
MEVKQLNEIVTSAGKIALDYFGKVDVSYKEDRSVVTQADLEVEKFLYDKLTRLIPGSGFVGEEGTLEKANESDYLWLVDPIDGTSSYIYRLPIWGVSVALFKSGQPCMASLYFPVINEHYWADENSASLNGEPLKPLEANREVRSESFICIPSKRYYRCQMEIQFKARSFGSSCYHVCQATRDSAYATIMGDYKIWDLAGGAVIGARTGSLLFDMEGNEVSPGSLIASSERMPTLVITHPDRVSNLLDRIQVRQVDVKKTGQL